MSWTKLSSETKFQNRFMRVTEDKIITDYGDQVVFGIVHKEPAVLIIPWDGAKFTLIAQYRYAIDKISWEFPAGHMEHDNIIEAAKAELAEEAGWIAESLIEIGEFAIAPGHNTQICHTYLATGLTPTSQNLEPSEKGMQIKQVSLSEINQMILSHEIVDGLTLAGLKILEIYNSNN